MATQDKDMDQKNKGNQDPNRTQSSGGSQQSGKQSGTQQGNQGNQGNQGSQSGNQKGSGSSSDKR